MVHGLDAGQVLLNVQIDVTETAEGVELVVENDGAVRDSNEAKVKGHGVGLSTTRARLLTAYGDRASMTLKPRPDGGMRVRIVLPGTQALAGSERPVTASA